MRQKLSQRLEYAMNLRKVNQKDIVDAIGVSKAAVSAWLSNDYEPKSDVVEKLANYLEVNPAWLCGWNVSIDPPEYDKERAILTIPFVSQKVACGNGEEFLSEDDMDIRQIDILAKMGKGYDKSLLLAAEAKGDSMIDENIFEGDVIVFARGIVEAEGLYVIALVDEVMVKRLSFDRINNKVTIISGNPKYDPRTVDADAVTILGKVTGWIHVN